MPQLIYSGFFFFLSFSGQIDGHKMLTCKSNSKKEVGLIYRWPLMILGFCILVHAIRINIHNKTAKKRE